MLVCALGVLLSTAVVEGGNAPIAAAFKWAQSPTQIHLFVKFAHKIDAPAYNNFARDNVEVDISENAVRMVAANEAKAFKVDLKLLKTIDTKASSYSIQTFGVSFVLTKREKLWARLLKDRNEKPRNMHIWWELYDKYNDAMEELKQEASGKSKGGKRWWKTYQYKCDVCREMTKRAVLNEAALSRLDSAIEHFEKADQGKENKTTGIQQATYILKKLCDRDTSKKLPKHYRRACKKILKRREVRRQLTVTIAAALLQRRDSSALEKRKVYKQMKKICGDSAGICPRASPTKPPSLCKICQASMEGLHGYLGLEKLEFADKYEADSGKLCGDVGLRLWPHDQAGEATCEDILRENEMAIRQILTKPESSRQKALVGVCKSTGLCKTKRKLRAEKDAAMSDTAKNDTSSDGDKVESTSGESKEAGSDPAPPKNAEAKDEL